MRVLYGVFIFGFFACSLAKSISPAADKLPFTLEEATVSKFNQRRLPGIWISDTEFQYKDIKTGDINILNAATQKSSLFLSKSVIEKYEGLGFSVSADRKFVLIKYRPEKLFRTSDLARYVVYSIADKAYYNVSNAHTVRDAKWGPKGSALVYVKKNDLYYLPAITSAMNAQQITTDGIPGMIFNGVTDWVYEDKVLNTNTAFYFSPNGDQLIFVKFNDSTVGEYQIMKYGEPGSYKNLYAKVFKVRFPKVGTQNPVHEIWWVDLTNIKNRRRLDGYSKSQPEKEVYYGQSWINNEVSVLMFSNRVQNESRMYVYPMQKNSSHVMYQTENKRGWANSVMPIFSQNPNRFLKITAQPVGKDEFDHLTMFTEKETYALTNGTFEVVDILDWDRQNKVIYYRATEEGSPSTIQVYRIDEAKGSKPYCLTCRIKSPEGRGCKHATAFFSQKFSYVVIQCNGPDPMMTYLYKNENPMKDALSVLDSSAELRAFLTKKLMPEIMNFTVPVPGPFSAEVRLYLPPNMDKSGKTKYPMILYVYGHMNSKQIYDSFKIDLEMYLTTNRSVIYAVVDARNTKNKGKNMLFAGYQRLGTVEMEDQITVTKHLLKTYNFIDSKRVGLWGMSYGGYSTLKIMQMDKEGIFQCGIALNPVIDFAFCDSMLAERHMRLIKDNSQAYLQASLLTDVKSLRGKNFFLVSANADDSIHYQQPMLLTRALELNDIMFDALSYPDEGHGLMGVRPHLFHSMDRYWKRCMNI